MSLLKRLNRRLLNYLSILLITLTLLVFPPTFTDHLPFLSQHPVTSVVIAQEQQKSEPRNPAQPPFSQDQREAVDFFKIAMGAIAGLVLFIYGVTRLAEGLEEVGEERTKNLLGKFTTNRFAGVATGIVATTLLESSSVTIILVIAMVSAGILTFVQSLGVVLGSNIGTAVGAQIISLNIELYVPILMFAGLLVLFLGRSARQKSLGIILLGFGLMFYGLEAIDAAMEPFREYQPFLDSVDRKVTMVQANKWL